ncbi:XRE family transcriptional regulator [Amycolatopsis jiangsuensis]|uniref:Transcriptional regulator with XRE-family HTH domain n=1 Tax=Amycolatopsis jiangsuensis TaxID=1181879 RepID=A0A840IWZ8_9PSEU|nr:XRE family transcriptional regulator [Amycolatopsis jiangsuensis]MBB4685732.1 transcriptional regulator with XRE-family HTH domain [Amycolatopsis jiangsuensis]
MARKIEEELAAAPPGPPGEERQQRLGERLRRLRHLRKLTIEQVAGEVGLSMSFLSMLERGQADISLSRFSRLADFYKISASELLVEDETTAGPAIVAPESLQQIDRGAGVTYRLLKSDYSGAQAVLVTFEPGASFSEVLAHKGRDFGWVISGELVLLYSDREYLLEERQFVEYDASKPHALRNDGDRPAEMIAFMNSPYW